MKGPDHSEQIFVFHAVGGHTNVLQIPKALGLPLAGGRTVPIDTLSLHAPSTIIAGLDHLGIPVTHYVGVDLHMVSPTSSLGQLATGKLSVSSMISDPTGATSLLEQVASHIYLGPGHARVRRPLPHERPDVAPRLRPDRHGRPRHRRPGLGLLDRSARLPVDGGAGGGGAGSGRWRLRLRRAVHRDPSDRPAEHGTPGDAASAGSAGDGDSRRGTGAVTEGATSGQASLDQVLRTGRRGADRAARRRGLRPRRPPSGPGAGGPAVAEPAVQEGQGLGAVPLVAAVEDVVGQASAAPCRS